MVAFPVYRTPWPYPQPLSAHRENILTDTRKGQEHVRGLLIALGLGSGQGFKIIGHLDDFVSG